jgi:glycerate dehydrogenase
VNVLLLGFADQDLEPQYWDRLKQVGEITMSSPDSPQLSDQLSHAEALLIKLGMGADKALIDTAPKLRYIGMLGTGYGRIDAVYAAERGIAVCNVADYSTEGVAEFTIGALLDHMRELNRARAQAAAGDYSEATFAGTEIRGKTFGVVGLGNIGRRVAETVSTGFGANTIYWSRSEKSGLPSAIERVAIEDLLASSDIVSLHLELNPNTERFIDRDALARLRKGAIMINTAPMELVDIDALVERLGSEEIAFILDHSDELAPSDAEKLARYPNCILYPPIAYTTVEATAAKQDIFVGNLEHFVQGSPTNQVN